MTGGSTNQILTAPLFLNTGAQRTAPAAPDITTGTATGGNPVARGHATSYLAFSIFRPDKEPHMKYRKLGKYGIRVSEIAIGGWLTYGGSVDKSQTKKIIEHGVGLGINFIDIADIYARGKSEECIGNAIESMTRTDLVISSKVFWPMSDNPNDRGLSRKHIMESIHRTLKRIGTDYLDIYFCHRHDPDVEVEEVVRVMEDLVRQGKILYWGTSVWTAAQIEQAVGDAFRLGGYLPAVEQPRYNMFDRHIETEILPTCDRHGLGLTVWSPLAQGLLTGKYNDGVPQDSRGGQTEWLKRDLTDDNLAKVRQLAELARQRGMTIGQLALAWILRLPQISCAIIGATKIEQVDENVRAGENALDPDTLSEIENILGNNPAVN
jgi:voltage-dependent potassium channel beta subunit